MPVYSAYHLSEKPVPIPRLIYYGAGSFFSSKGSQDKTV